MEKQNQGRERTWGTDKGHQSTFDSTVSPPDVLRVYQLKASSTSAPTSECVPKTKARKTAPNYNNKNTTSFSFAQCFQQLKAAPKTSNLEKKNTTRVNYPYFVPQIC